jgi:hypothetical protein
MMPPDLTNPQDIPADLTPGVYCCRVDEVIARPWRIWARFVTPPRLHEPGDCLIQFTKTQSALSAHSQTTTREERNGIESLRQDRLGH